MPAAPPTAPPDRAAPPEPPARRRPAPCPPGIRRRGAAALRAAAAALAALPALAAAGAELRVPAGPQAEERLQAALEAARPGDVVMLEAGRYALGRGLSLGADGATLEGAGAEATILSFEGREAGEAGLLVSGDDAILRGFAIEDAAPAALRVRGANGVALIGIRVARGAGGAPADGIVLERAGNALIDGVAVEGPWRAGVRIDRARNVLLRGSRIRGAQTGVALLDSSAVDVIDNALSENRIGIAIAARPGAAGPQGAGSEKAARDGAEPDGAASEGAGDAGPRAGRTRVLRNRIRASGAAERPASAADPTLAPAPAGAGLAVLGGVRDVEIFENDFAENRGANVLILAHPEADDSAAAAFPTRVHVHHNAFAPAGTPRVEEGSLAALLIEALGAPLPDVTWDGAMPRWSYFLLGQDAEDRISVHDNAHAPGARGFGNAHLMMRRLAPWLHRPDFGTAQLAPGLAPLPAARVIVRGQDVAAQAPSAEPAAAR
ncbi:right-handed parallel beta-helix repeat-containing protein [Oceanicella actignis]|uniref:Parallel beta-helix repeat-containing protein n=1 Tax=Oceanicella actignis TaxID=1189325 RepID=A0A1M7S2C3_9RHOB|nr:right-handed parallel beta-helix repeat-containing protein [Oceanicella actignis]SES90475.1 parallel beta-helix repeat-containing protein [Oceanicella actignis]SHN52631.1 parallel beta-helix repeat-containing protein [Oceanicella actignis]